MSAYCVQIAIKRALMLEKANCSQIISLREELYAVQNDSDAFLIAEKMLRSWGEYESYIECTNDQHGVHSTDDDVMTGDETVQTQQTMFSTESQYETTTGGEEIKSDEESVEIMMTSDETETQYETTCDTEIQTKTTTDETETKVDETQYETLSETETAKTTTDGGETTTYETETMMTTEETQFSTDEMETTTTAEDDAEPQQPTVTPPPNVTVENGVLWWRGEYGDLFLAFNDGAHNCVETGYDSLYIPYNTTSDLVFVDVNRDGGDGMMRYSGDPREIEYGNYTVYSTEDGKVYIKNVSEEDEVLLDDNYFYDKDNLNMDIVSSVHGLTGIGKEGPYYYAYFDGDIKQQIYGWYVKKGSYEITGDITITYEEGVSHADSLTISTCCGEDICFEHYDECYNSSQLTFEIK